MNNLSELGSCGEIVGKNIILINLRVLHVKLSLTFTQMSSVGKIRNKNLILVNIGGEANGLIVHCNFYLKLKFYKNTWASLENMVGFFFLWTKQIIDKVLGYL
jgi:hypothetical protein